MKKQLLLGALLLSSLSVMAQTDVTSTYLDNAGFDIADDYVTTAVCTYAKDVTGNNADGSSLMAVTNWTAGADGDAKAGGCFGFGTGAWVATSSATVPATNSEGNAEGGALGLGGCWGGNAFYTQDLKQNLSEGTYTIEICGYNAGSATAFGTQTFGIKEAGGTTHYVTTTWTAGKWTTATLNFEITAETAGTFYLGATGVSGGSASSAKLYIDYVKIYKAKSLQDLMDEATEDNPADVTSFYLQNAAVTGTDGWTNGRVNSGQQYTDAPDNTYLDSWNATYDQKQVVTLKPGKYTLKAATRAISGISVANIYANIAGGSKNSTDITAVGNTDGELGNGWGWTTVDFIVTEESEVTIGFYSECGSGKWAGADNFSLLYDRKITDDDLMPAALAELESALSNAAQIEEDYVGEGAFLYNEDEFEEYDEIMSTASMYLYGMVEGATLQDIKDQVEAVNNATVPSLNAPDASQAYKIILKYDGWNYNNCAITPMAGARSDMGGYNIQYKPQNPNYAQACYFNAVEDGYKISFTDAEGATRYICTGVSHGGNTSQIRTTTEADNALVVDVRRNGEYLQLWNTEANNYIGSQDAGVFTVNSHIDFVVEETEGENEVSVSLAAGYATVCLPYTATTEAKAYEISGVEENGATLTMTEVTSLEANKAYILEGTETQNFSGVNIAYTEPSANGLLTGVFTDKTAPAGSYVMQNHKGTVGFYLVDETTPTVKANRAYIAPESAGAITPFVKAFYFNQTDAINAIEALTNGAKIYDINGREINKLQNGINIVDGKKIMVK